MKILKRVLKIFMILLVLLFIGISIFFLTFDLNSYKGMIASKASAALGRPVTIEKMSMKISLIPTVAVEGVKIANTSEPGFDPKQSLLQIDSMDVTLALIPLLKGNIELKDFNLSSANIVLIEKDGKNNWTFGDEKTASPAPVKKQQNAANDNILDRLHVDNISVKKLSVSYTQNDKTQKVSLVNVSVKQLRLVSMSVVYDGKTIKLSGNIGDIAALIAKKPNYAFSMTVEAFEAIAKISGTIGDTAKFSNMMFNVSVSGKNLRNSVAYVAKSLPQVPGESFALDTVIKGDLDGEFKVTPLTVTLGGNKAVLKSDVTLKNVLKQVNVLASGDMDITNADLVAPYGIKPMNVAFDVQADPQKAEIKKLLVNANKSDVDLTGSVSLAETVPAVTAKITSQYLDPYDFIIEKQTAPAAQTQQKSGANTGLFSDEKIDLSALKSVNADMSLTAKNIKVPDFDYVGVAMQGALKNGDLSVPSFVARTSMGTVSGSARVNAGVSPAAMTLKINSDEIKLNVIKAVREQLQDSVAALSANLTTKGDSVKSLVSALNGQIVVEVSEGTIVNKWFNSLPVAMGVIKNKSNAMSFSASDQVSKLVCGAVNLNVKNGVITSADQIAIETSAVNFSVSGTINLPAETLSLTMVPSLPQGSDKTQNALALTQIVKISGPFTDLKPSLDTKKAAQTAVQTGLGVLANKIAEKQGVSLPTQTKQTSGVNLCEKALGRPLKGQTANRVAAPVQQQTPKAAPKQTEQKLAPKEQFKQQLLNSLSEALKK